MYQKIVLPSQADFAPVSPLLTIKQIASRWLVSKETVERRIRSGQLPALKLGRCVRVSADALVNYESTRNFIA